MRQVSKVLPRPGVSLNQPSAGASHRFSATEPDLRTDFSSGSANQLRAHPLHIIHVRVDFDLECLDVPAHVEVRSHICGHIRTNRFGQLGQLRSKHSDMLISSLITSRRVSNSSSLGCETGVVLNLTVLVLSMINSSWFRSACPG
jgi:hypothetical protein